MTSGSWPPALGEKPCVWFEPSVTPRYGSPSNEPAYVCFVALLPHAPPTVVGLSCEGREGRDTLAHHCAPGHSQRPGTPQVPKE